ncbi:MAG: hypothetical protein AB1489_03195, partial [Acidobacteriota bacterium]
LTQEQAEKYKAALESIGAQASISVLEEGKSEIEQRQDITPQDNRENVYTTATKLVNPSPSAATFPTPEPDFPVFHNNSESDVSIKATPPAVPDPFKTKIAEAMDPLKTQPESARLTSANRSSTSEEDEVVTRPQSSIVVTGMEGAEATEESWRALYILNPPFDPAAAPITPITTGRVSAQPGGFSLSHPMIEKITFDTILLVSVFQVGLGSEAKRYIDIFGSLLTRPVRLDTTFINYRTFTPEPAEDPLERISYFVKYVLGNNYSITVDLSTYRFLKDQNRIKMVAMDRDIEKYCGKLQTEIDKGLDPKLNPNILTWEQADEHLDENDPWAAPPPMPQFPPMPGLQPGFAPPGAFITQPMQPPTTGAPLASNYTQPQPPFIQPPSQQPPVGYQQPPYAPPTGSPPANMAPPSAPFSKPQGYPPQVAPPTINQPPPFGMSAPPLPGQPPQMYAGPMPGQFGGKMAMPGMPAMAPNYANPGADFELNKARDNAKTALVLAIIGGLPCLGVCLFPLAIAALLKAQNALQVMDNYGTQAERSTAITAKTIAIIGLIINSFIIIINMLR